MITGQRPFVLAIHISTTLSRYSLIPGCTRCNVRCCGNLRCNAKETKKIIWVQTVVFLLKRWDLKSGVIECYHYLIFFVLCYLVLK